MFDRTDNLCDVPVISMKRSFRMAGLTHVIATVADHIRNHNLGPTVLDLSQIARLRWSEIMGLADHLGTQINPLFAGFIMAPDMLTRMDELGLTRLLPMATSRTRLAQRLSIRTMQSTRALLFCNDLAPLLGPLADCDPHSLCDVAGQRPWLDGLIDLHHLGVRDVTIVLTGPYQELAQSFQANCPPGMILRFQKDAETKTANILQACAGQIAMPENLLLVDGRFRGRQALTELYLSHQQRGAGYSELVAGMTSPAAVLSSDRLATLGKVAPWADDLARSSGGNNRVVAEHQWSLNTTALTWAQALFSHHTDHGGLIGHVSDGAALEGQNYVAASARIESGACLRNSIVLPYTHVTAGAWLTNMIVGPNWALRYDDAAKSPLNLTPVDCVGPVPTLVDLERRVA